MTTTDRKRRDAQPPSAGARVPSSAIIESAFGRIAGPASTLRKDAHDATLTTVPESDSEGFQRSQTRGRGQTDLSRRPRGPHDGRGGEGRVHHEGKALSAFLEFPVRPRPISESRAPEALQPCCR